MLVPRRHSSDSYSYGFNGKEKDDELKGGDGNHYDYGFRIYDPRIGRFLSQDPLFQSYPWYTPYQYAGNTPISCVDLDGLEMYFAADGSFLGQSIKGGTEIRIATSYTTFESTDKKGKISERYRITASKPVTQFDLKTAGKVYQTIYDREIKGNAKVKAESSSNETSKGAEASKDNPIEMNIAYTTVEESFGNKEIVQGNDYYYNVTNTLFHEDKHVKGMDGSGFDHFSIWESQIKHASYSKTTSGYKNFLKAIGLQYLSHMEINLMRIHDRKNYSNSEKNDNFNHFYEIYLEALKVYNEIYQSDYKPAKKDDLIEKPMIENIENRK